MSSDELKTDKCGIKIRVENATLAENGDVEASVSSLHPAKTNRAVTFLLENRGDAAVQLCQCDVLKSYGFTRGQIANKGMIEPGRFSEFAFLCYRTASENCRMWFMVNFFDMVDVPMIF